MRMRRTWTPNPHLSRVWHRVGQQATVPAPGGTNRRLTVSEEALRRGRIDVLQPQQD